MNRKNRENSCVHPECLCQIKYLRKRQLVVLSMHQYRIEKWKYLHVARFLPLARNPLPFNKLMLFECAKALTDNL
jgi:hypothetical protein